MIFGNISNLDEYSYLNDKFKAAFKFFKDNDLKSFQTGRHEIDGDDLFVNIVSYDTTTEEERFWEAHKDYIDLHVLIEGSERIDLNFLDNMEKGDYVKEDDFQKAFGEKNSTVNLLKQGDFLICYPNDCHMTALIVEDKSNVKKAIFKIKL